MCKLMMRGPLTRGYLKVPMIIRSNLTRLQRGGGLESTCGSKKEACLIKHTACLSKKRALSSRNAAMFIIDLLC